MMDFGLSIDLARAYDSPTQIIRIITEDWVSKNSYCPNCGNERLNHFGNNRPVADFYCDVCSHEFELKSKSGKLGEKIVDGAYNSMIDRIEAENNPNFFFLSYNKATFRINNFLIIPKHYFVRNLIEKRKPLSTTAKRAGWTGCNILLSRIPESGRIFLIKDDCPIEKAIVLKKWEKTCFLSGVNQESKSWLIDIMRCIDLIPSKIFSLPEIYSFESLLKDLHPDNNFVKDKIRQQLQVLRDKNQIEFLGKGFYRKNC